MSFDCLELGDSLYLDGTTLKVKLATDSRISLDATDGIYLDDDELSTDWISWTPTFASPPSFTLGNATVEAYYMRFGQLIFWKISMKLGTTTSMGTGGPYFQLPVPPATWGQIGASSQPLGFWLGLPVSGSAYVGQIGQGASSTATVGNLSAGGTYAIGSILNTTTPFTWATGDTWIGQGYYERA